MHPAKRLAPDKPLQRLKSQGKLPDGPFPLVRKRPALQRIKRIGIFRPVNNAQVFPAPTFDGGLNQVMAG